MKSVLETDHQRGLAVTAKVEDVELLFGGQGVVASASYSATYSNPRMQQQVQGSFLFVLERGGDGWKIRAASATRLQPAGRSVVQLAQDGSLPLRGADRGSRKPTKGSSGNFDCGALCCTISRQSERAPYNLAIVKS